MFSAIVKDMRDNAKAMAPAEVWAEAGGGACSQAKDFPAESLLQPWLGFGAERITPGVLGWYYSYLKEIDRFGIVDYYFADEDTIRPAGENLIVADLGTIIDLNLASLHVDTTRPFNVVEIGGGYGRLAEAFLNLFPGHVRWIMIDAVPASMVYAVEYLHRACPQASVGSYYDGTAIEGADCYIVPSWRIDLLAGMRFDLAVNVQSMQEMDQHQVDFYIAWLDQALKANGLAYLVNRRDHVFRGEWSYPRHWQCLMKTPSPRSFLRDMPTEIFRKTDRDQTFANAAAERLYRQQLAVQRDIGLNRARKTGLAAY